MRKTFLHCILTMLFIAVTGSVRADVITIPTTGSIDRSNLIVSHNSMVETDDQIVTNVEYNRWIKMDVQTATAGDYELKISIQALTLTSDYTGSFRVTTSIPEVDVEWAGDADNAGKYNDAVVIISRNSNNWKDYHILFHNVPANQVMTIRLDVLTTPSNAISCGNFKDFKITNVTTPAFQTTYYLNYTDAPTPTSKKMSYYASTCKLLQYPVRSGYKCKGWYTTSSGSTKPESATSSTPNLYAQWTNIVQTIPNDNFSFSAVRISEETRIYNAKVSIIKDLTAEYEVNATQAGDYDIIFWARSATYNKSSQVKFTASDENIVFDWMGDNSYKSDYYENNKVTVPYTSSSNDNREYHVIMRNVPAGRFTFTITGLSNDTHIRDFAIKKKSSVTPVYSLTYDLNDNGTSSDKRVKDYYKNGYSTMIVTNPARRGYTFLGWYDQRTGGNKYADNKYFSSSDNGKTIYAQWEQLEGNYNPIDGNADIVSSFSFSNGVNPDKLGQNTGVFVGGTYDGQKAHGTSVSFAANTTITVKFPESFKNYDGQLYDIFATTTSNVAVKKLNSSLSGSAPNFYISFGPAEDVTPVISQHVEMWLEKDGVRVTNINFVAGCCYMAANKETLNVYGNNNTLYSNVTADMLSFSAKGWAPIDASYDQPFFYFMGNGLSPDHSVKLDYNRTSQGGCEFTIGYIKYTYTFECPSRNNVNIDVPMNSAPTIPSAAAWINDVEEWTANVDIETTTSTIIPAGTPISISDLANTVATSDVIFSGVENEQITDQPGTGQSLAEFQAAVRARLLAIKGTPYNITINRTFYKDGGNNTISLPFSLTESELADSPLAGFSELKEFTSAEIVNPGEPNETLELTITDATEIVAGKPYLIKWESGEDLENPIFENVTVTREVGDTVTSDKVQFIGTFVPKDVTEGDKGILFVGTDAELKWPNAAGNINGFRAFFELDLDAPSSPLRQGMKAMLAGGKTTPTSVDNAQCTMHDVQKLIQEGRVVIISNGVRYDLNGNIVK